MKTYYFHQVRNGVPVAIPVRCKNDTVAMLGGILTKDTLRVTRAGGAGLVWGREESNTDRACFNCAHLRRARGAPTCFDDTDGAGCEGHRTQAEFMMESVVLQVRDATNGTAPRTEWRATHPVAQSPHGDKPQAGPAPVQ